MTPFLRALVLALTAALLADPSMAQCDGCVPDLSCTSSPAFPTLCPATAPDAIAGEYYQVDFTFWMPATFADPGSGFTVDLLQLTITGVSGLPFGLAFTASEPSGVYYPPDNEYGCARVCGTPIGPGIYTVDIAVLAHVSASGIELDVPQTLSTVITVLPGSGGNTSFSYTPTAGCGSVTTSFQALIDASPAPMSYAWDLGNGVTSTSPNPPAQTYNGAGSYEVFLQTTIGGYVLNAVNVTGTNTNWCGDVEEPSLPIIGCTGSPDLYFVLTNSGGGAYTSSTVDNTTTASWSELGILLNSPPYSLSIYDEDVVSGDDLLGTYNIPANGAGTYFINVAGGTTGSLVITNEPQQVFLDSALVTVFSVPDVSLIENATTGELCAQGEGLVGYAWLFNGVVVPDVTSECYMPTGPGLWQVVGTNGFGCTDSSNVVVVCPVFEIVRNGNVLFVPSSYLAYAWTFNGSPLSGNDPFIFLQGDGTYTVTVDAGNGCIIVSSFVWSTVGIEEADSAVPRMELFPNPNDGAFTIVAEGVGSSGAYIELMDMTGRVIWQTRSNSNGGLVRVNATVHAVAGAYTVRLHDGDHIRTTRCIIR
ncbi:MAG: T9SS type A sorting domain-containing protein [Flavobacteriales bacterium]|nr:T9SS type A sorting domain-containing protein [Flavobacteriales bacterium]